jgi:hypothetical protein
MTIIRPHSNRSLLLFVGFFGLLAVGGGILLVCEYGAVASARFELGALKEQIVSLQVTNADLKETLVSMTGATKLREKASEFGLTLEKRPEYLNERQWLSDSSL